MTTLLTGASGFVGRHAQNLLDCLPLEGEGALVDLREVPALTEAVGRAMAQGPPRWVLHLAAQSNVPDSFADPRKTFDINFIGTLNLLQALARHDFSGRMLYVGSGAVYGQVPVEALPVAEDHPLRPRNPYAVSKTAAEALCHQWSRTGPFEIVIARPFNHIGPGQGRGFALTDFASQIVAIRRGRQEPAIQVGDVDVTRDFCDVRDVVRAYRLLLDKGRNGEAYNVCSGTERSIRAILGQLLERAGTEVRIEQDPGRLRPAEQRRMRGSNEKLRRETGWEPEIPWETTLNDLLNDWENHPNE